MTIKFKFLIDDYSASNYFNHCAVNLNPEINGDGEYVLYSNGRQQDTPLREYHNIDKCILTASKLIVVEELESFIRDHADKIKAIIACYKGSEWDGKNNVGRWDDKADDLIHELGQEFQDMDANNELIHWATRSEVDELMENFSVSERNALVAMDRQEAIDDVKEILSDNHRYLAFKELHIDINISNWAENNN